MKNHELSISLMFDRESLRIQALVTAIADALRSIGVAKAVVISPAFWTAQAQRVPEYLQKLTDVSVADALASAWKVNRQFVKYTDTKQYPAGKETTVELFTHAIKTSYSPYLEVRLNGQHAGKLEFALELELALKVGSLMIRDGRFMRLGPGGCEVTGTLTFQKQPVTDKKFKAYPWDGVPLGPEGRGIEISRVV